MPEAASDFLSVISADSLSHVGFSLEGGGERIFLFSLWEQRREDLTSLIRSLGFEDAVEAE